MIRLAGAVHFCGDLSEPGAQVLDKALSRHRKVEPLTILRHFRLALLPGEQLVTIIGKLFAALYTEIPRLQFSNDIREDTGFQVLAAKPTFAFAPHQHRALPFLAGKWEFKGRFQVLLRVVLMGNEKVHRIDERLVRTGGLEIEGLDHPE